MENQEFDMDLAENEDWCAIKRRIAGVRKYGTYKKYMRAPHREVLACRGLVVRGLHASQRSDTTPWPDAPATGGGGSVGTGLSAMFEGGDLLRVDGAIVAVLPDASIDASSTLDEEHGPPFAKGLAGPGVSSAAASSSASFAAAAATAAARARRGWAPADAAGPHCAPARESSTGPAAGAHSAAAAAARGPAWSQRRGSRDEGQPSAGLYAGLLPRGKPTGLAG